MGGENKSSSKLFSFVMVLMIAILVFVLYLNNNYKIVDVSGSSMYPTLQSGDVLFMSNVEVDEYGSISTKNGDIIIIEDEKFNAKGESQLLIKRQIAKGEKDRTVVVEIKDGYVYVDGEMLKEEYLFAQAITDCKGEQNRWELNENDVFYLGDNRKESMDSRYDEYGLCSTSQVVGTVAEKAISFKWLSKAIYDLSNFFKGIFNN
jgi:signal peptidase I